MTSSRKISLGLDYGTNSARALFVDTATGEEIGCGVSDYASGEAGIVVDDASPHLARQVPADWERSTEEAVSRSLEDARAKDSSLDVSSALVGIGIDATASTPLPVDAKCRPLAESSELRDEHAALAWLWKDHTAHAEAEEITALAAERLPEHLDRCGGAYTSEWYFAKLLRCLREAPAVVEHAADWIEQGDWIAGFLTGCDDPRKLPRNVCAAGHKGFYHDAHGWPPAEFLAALDPKLAAWTSGKLDQVPVPAGSPAGTLGAAWADRLGLREGTPVSVAAIDAHVGAVGAGIRPGVLVKILGTSACDMIVHPEGSEGGDLGKIEGLSGIVRGSILPGHWGLEAGQSAVGDIFGWFVREFAKPAGLDHEDLTREAATLRPGETGLLALDWNNGNRSVLADPLLSGLLVGQTLRTRPAEVYRALLEATAFGARVILERIGESGVRIDETILCGGIAERNALLLELYADVWNMPLRLSRSDQTCALGSAVFGAVVGGAHADVLRAREAMCGVREESWIPDSGRAAVYDRLYALYRKLHDAFGGVSPSGDALGSVMKDLLALRPSGSAAGT